MTAEEWERIKSLFDAARRLPSAQQSEYLDTACATRPDLKSVVEQLLKNDAEAGAFLEDQSLPSSAPVFQCGQVVAGRFRVVRLIAGGGMGEVYEVFDERLSLRVALKTIRNELVASPEAYTRFKREVSVTREVVHEGICRVFELIEHRDPADPDAVPVPCLTMKLLDGVNLQQYVRTRRPLSPEQALPLIRQICQALQALHDYGVIHRDLKPSNIMLTEGSSGTRVILTDFGLARRLDQTTVTVGAGSEGQPGAPYFLAPEVLKGERESVASDIYALGLVIDEMVTATRAFTAESIHALYWQKLWEQPLAPTRRAPGLPSAWERVILRCLSSNPAERFARAMDVIAALESADAAASPPRLKPRRRSIVMASLAVPLLGLLAFIPFLWSSSPVTMMVSAVANDTGRKELDYVARGTTSELLRHLSRIEGLHVYPAPESASEQAQLRQRSRYWLRPQLTHAAGRYRLSAQVADNTSGTVVWSIASEKSEDDALTLESDVAEGAARSLETHLRGPSAPAVRTIVNPVLAWLRPPQGALPRPATRSSSAFQSYIRGQNLFEERSVASARLALDYYRQAIQDDPRFALAYAAMADVQRFLMEQFSNQMELRTEARTNAERAVSLDPDLPEAWATLGAVMQVEWEWTKSDEAYRRAIGLHPRFARARRQFGGLLLQTGKVDEGLAMIRDAIELDPYDYPNHSAYGFALFHAERPLDAIAHLDRLIQTKDMFQAHITLGQVHATLAASRDPAQAADHEAKALREASILEKYEMRARQDSVQDSRKWSALVYAITLANRNRPQEARQWLDVLEAGRKAGFIASVTVAYAHAALRDYDRALDLLDMAAAYHEKELGNVRIAPYFRPMHSNPRFRRLLTTMRLPVEPERM